MPEPTTRLHVWITDYDKDDEEKIRQLMNANEFPIQYTHKPSDDGIEFQSHAFEYNDENLEKVEDMKGNFESEFSSRTVKLQDGTLGEHVAIDFFECIRIEPPVESADSNHSTQKQEVDETGEDIEQQETNEAIDNMTTCPECGGNNVVYDDSAEESVCSDCGLVFENSADTTEDADKAEWRTFADSGGEQKEKLERSSFPTHSSEESTQSEEFEVDITHGDDAPAPESADEWRMWYPCPECQSTALHQITEQHLSVSATEDGSYGGDAGGMEEYDYIECSDCGAVLLDEIGRAN